MAHTISKEREAITRLGHLHPYPAMVPNELAMKIASRHVKSGFKVFDPFCGTGRLLIAAAVKSGTYVGLDVNPLACLISKAKVVDANVSEIQEFLSFLLSERVPQLSSPFELKESRRVDWYSEKNLLELSHIVSCTNRMNLSQSEKLVIAAALSAAARDASYCRNSGWKLHRMSDLDRASHEVSALESFAKRLNYYISASVHSNLLKGKVEVFVGNASKISSYRLFKDKNIFDLVLTSPPYGDSKTTVQYGAASGLCLDVISNIRGLESVFRPGSVIDSLCLGGKRCCDIADKRMGSIKSYWSGSLTNPQFESMSAFLFDYKTVCGELARLIKPGGKSIFVVGQRSSGGFRLKLDRFTINCFEELGFNLESIEKRPLKEKHLPRSINKFGRSKCVEKRSKGNVATMRDEYVVVMKKP